MRLSKRFGVIVFAALLSSCANQFEQPVEFNPMAVSPKLLMSVGTLAVKDARLQKALAIINKTEAMPVDDVARLIEPWLKNSIKTNPNGRKKLTFNITNATRYIKQYAMTFESEAVLEWLVEIESKNSTWKKSYQTGINQNGPLTLDQEEVTKNINLMLITLYDRTMRDPEFQKALSQ